MNVKVESLVIDDSKFEITEAYQGGFLYVISFTNDITVTITKS